MTGPMEEATASVELDADPRGAHTSTERRMRRSAMLRQAAETMRREHTEFFDRLADWLDSTASFWPGARHDTDMPYAVATAEAYLADPGELPAAITGGSA